MKLGEEKSGAKEISTFQITGDLVGHIADAGLSSHRQSEKWKTHEFQVENSLGWERQESGVLFKPSPLEEMISSTLFTHTTQYREHIHMFYRLENRGDGLQLCEFYFPQSTSSSN